MRQRETKAERFVRVAEQRTQRAVDAIHSLSNCASRVCYDYTPEQVEQFTTSWDSGCITELYADYDMARFAMLKGIREEQAEGCIKDWADRDALEEEYCTDFYEAWHRDEYSEKHFTASIEKLSLTLPQRIIEAE